MGFKEGRIQNQQRTSKAQAKNDIWELDAERVNMKIACLPRQVQSNEFRLNSTEEVRFCIHLGQYKSLRSQLRKKVAHPVVQVGDQSRDRT